MKPFNFIAGRAHTAIAVALLAAAGLSGCGGSHDNDNSGGTPPAPTPVVDLFFGTVSNFVAISSETAESVPIDVFVSTAPDNTEPEPLG